jgi:hypothetical protein
MIILLPTPYTNKTKTGCLIDALQFLKIISPNLAIYMSHLKTQKQQFTNPARST